MGRSRRPWCFREKWGQRSGTSQLSFLCSAVSHPTERSDKTRTGKAHKIYQLECRLLHQCLKSHPSSHSVSVSRDFPRARSWIISSVFGGFIPFFRADMYFLLCTVLLSPLISESHHLMVHYHEEMLAIQALDI